MRYTFHAFASLTVLALGAAGVMAQDAVPEDQPSLLTIYMEEIKLGHASAYEATSSGWPEAQEEAAYSTTYLALEAMTGPSMVWYVEPFDNFADEARAMKEREDNAALSTELQRLWDAHGEHMASARTVQLIGRPDLSGGHFPDLATQRYWDITVFRVKPGHDAGFEEAASTYAAVTNRLGQDPTFRTYQVLSGMPAGTYMIFGSVSDYASFDDVMARDMSTWESMTDDERELFEEFSLEGMASSITYRFALSPTMSYVPAEMKAADPEFWGN